MANEDAWWYASDGKPVGPVGFGVLRNRATTGELKPHELVWCEGMRDWVAAATVAGLFPVEATGPVPAPPPVPGFADAPAASRPGVATGRTCMHCRSASLVAGRGYRSHGCFVVVGYVMMLPAFLVLAAGAFLLFASSAVLGLPTPPASTGNPTGATEACAAGCCTTALGGLALSAVTAGALATVAGLLGMLIAWFLVRRRQVLRCTECGSSMPGP